MYNLDILDKYHLNLKLRPIFIGYLMNIHHLEHRGYSYQEGAFQVVLYPNKAITSEFIREYASKIGSEIFIHEQDFIAMKDVLKKEINSISRSLSFGDPVAKGKKQANLLSLQMSLLYSNPYDDELLTEQFNSSRNFSKLLYKNKKIHSEIYQIIKKQSHHYTIMQPLLSSILVLSFMQSSGLFSEKEVQQYFLTSYFKDIGMGLIPREKFDMGNLNEFDKNLFDMHAKNSRKILDTRAPLSQNLLGIIENHHFLNYKMQSILSNKNEDISSYISGVESVILSSFDIIVAMSSQRPYRDPVSVYKALEVLKLVISDEYPKEFKNMVIFIKSFFKN